MPWLAQDFLTALTKPRSSLDMPAFSALPLRAFLEVIYCQIGDDFSKLIAYAPGSVNRPRLNLSKINRLPCGVLNCTSMHLDYLDDWRNAHVKSPMISGVFRIL